MEVIYGMEEGVAYGRESAVCVGSRGRGYEYSGIMPSLWSKPEDRVQVDKTLQGRGTGGVRERSSRPRVQTGDIGYRCSETWVALFDAREVLRKKAARNYLPFKRRGSGLGFTICLKSGNFSVGAASSRTHRTVQKETVRGHR
jgi:hypothetical protein